MKIYIGCDHRGLELKEKVIKYAINNIKNVKLEECIMIGDRRYDIEGAKINNIKSIGVTYGFGTQEELEKAGADHIVADVNALENIIMNSWHPIRGLQFRNRRFREKNFEGIQESPFNKGAVAIATGGS